MDSNFAVHFRSATLADKKEFVSEEEIVREGIRLQKEEKTAWLAYMYGVSHPYQGTLIARMDETKEAFAKFLFEHRKILFRSKEFNSK
jgi:hypothetical protein